MIRIRYNRISDKGILSSRRAFRTPDGREYRIEVDTNNMTFRVYNNRDQSIAIEGGRSCNLNVIKNQAKAALIELGATFEAEVRQPKTKKQRLFPSVRNPDYIPSK